MTEKRLPADAILENLPEKGGVLIILPENTNGPYYDYYLHPNGKVYNHAGELIEDADLAADIKNRVLGD